jgi:hypothetical protein
LGKRKKQAASSAVHSGVAEDLARDPAARPPASQPPRRRPGLLIVSVLLFAASLVFLLITALGG